MDLWEHMDDHIAKETGYEADDITYLRGVMVEPHLASLAAQQVEKLESLARSLDFVKLELEAERKKNARLEKELQHIRDQKPGIMDWMQAMDKKRRTKRNSELRQKRRLLAKEDSTSPSPDLLEHRPPETMDTATMTDNYDQTREIKKLRSQLEVKQCELRELQKNARSGRLRSLS